MSTNTRSPPRGVTMLEQRLIETLEKVQTKRLIVLQNWQEASGNLIKFSTQEELVTVELTCGTLIFPANSTQAQILHNELDKSKGAIGQKIGIIRTDDAERPIIIRKIPLQE